MITSLKFNDQVGMIGICIIWIVAGILPIAVSEVSLSSTRSWYSDKERFVLTCTLPDFNKNIQLGNQKIPKIVECFARRNCFLSTPNTRYTAEKNGTTQLVLAISSFDHTQDTGEWNCTYINDSQAMYSVFKVYLANGPKSVVLSPATLTYTVTEKTGSVGPITCVADCIPNCTMTWNGPNLPAGTSSELNLHNINRNQTGDYRCTARNSIGNLTSDIVLVIVNYGPISVVLTPSLLSYTVTEIKESVGPIYCTADCRPNCTLTWRGPYLAGNTTSVLILQRINRNQAGDYQCEAVNSAGNLTSEILAVQVEYGPNSVILSPSTPSSYTVTETTGSVGPITCTADCRPNCTMTWSGPNLPAGTISELNLHNIKRNQTGDYQCTAVNNISSQTSLKVTVIVNYGPSVVLLTPSTPSYTVRETEDSVGPIACTADCRPNCTMKWNGPNLPDGSTSLLNILNITRYQAGDYKCSVKNSIGSLVSGTITVIVNYVPTITSIEGNDIYAENDTATLHCQVDSIPKSTISWKFIDGSSETMLPIENEPTIKVNDTLLTVSQMSCLSMGLYICEASNDIGKAFKTLNITVMCPPKLNTIEYTIPNRIAVYENQALNITAPILAFPRPWIYWQFFQVNSFINISSENESTYNLNRHFSIIYIENMTENKFGEYAIFAGNGVERTRSIGMFNVQAARRPNKPSHLNCSVGYNYIIFNWQPEFNGGSPQSFRIFYKNIQKQAFIGHPDIVSETEYHPVKIENLRPSSGYILKVHAINIFNKTESDEITCNTSREEVNKAESLIAVGVGTGVGTAVVIIISVLIVFFFYRQRRAKRTKNDKEPIKRINEEEEENDDLKDNPLYILSFDDAVSNVAIKDKVLKKKKQGNGKKSIEMAIVYENPDDFMNGKDQIYANQLITDKSTTEYKPKKNKDGLIYADLDLVPITEERKFVIHGMDNRNTYAIIDLSKKADPLSSDDEEEENADKKK